jgi:signal transduction histidine kinase
VQPLRRPLQRRIDRLVYGDRADPYAALARLGRRLADAPSTTEVLPAVVDSVAEALRPAYVAIELEGRAGPEVVAARGRPGSGEVTGIALVHRGERVARMLVEPHPGDHLSPSDRRLLGDLAGHAAVAAAAVRLTADLQRSRERLVVTREEERRRLRQDLHDGIGPTLAAMVLGIGAAGRAVRDPSGDSQAAHRLLDGLRATAKDAVVEVRRMVEGLGPASLDELGLMEALRVHADRLEQAGGPAIEVRGPTERPALPAAVEVAAYRVVCEALTNAARHGGASRCDVAVTVGDDLAIAVVDDGDGLPADAVPGVGLTSMRDRAAELGGTFAVDRTPGGGTAVRVVLPLAAT